MELLKHFRDENGYQEIAGGEKSCLNLLKLDFLKLSTGQEYSGNTMSYELAFVILAGKIDFVSKTFNIKIDDLGKRKHVFDGKPYVIYLPRDAHYSIKCLENSEIAICGAICEEQLEPFIVSPNDIIVSTVGELNWKRDIYNLIDERFRTSKLCIGEAYNHPGNWSSYPPHKHDTSDLPVEGVMQEIYFYRYNLPQGFGFQAVYTDDGAIDETYRVRNNDAVEIPYGYHPYVCAPGYYGYMLWLMAGEKRGFYRRTAPEHAWIDALDIVQKKSAMK